MGFVDKERYPNVVETGTFDVQKFCDIYAMVLSNRFNVDIKITAVPKAEAKDDVKGGE